jgi:hypothetical protein
MTGEVARKSLNVTTNTRTKQTDLNGGSRRTDGDNAE